MRELLPLHLHRCSLRRKWCGGARLTLWRITVALGGTDIFLFLRDSDIFVLDRSGHYDITIIIVLVSMAMIISFVYNLVIMAAC